MDKNLEKKLLAEFGDMFPGYRLEESEDEGYKLLRENAIELEDGREAAWVATVYDIPELFVLMELNRQIVNERNEIA